MDRILIVYYLLGFYLNRITSREKLSLVRKALLRKLEKFLVRNSRYYARAIPENGGLMHLPIMTKTQHFANFDTINTVDITYDKAMETALKAEHSRDFSPMIEDIAVGLSSGTTGNRGLFLTSRNERCRWVAAMIHRVIGWSWRSRKMAFFLRANNRLYESSNSSLIRFQFFDLSRPFGQLMTELSGLDPDILIAQPSVLSVIADGYLSGKISIRPQKIISVAEVLEDDIKMKLEQVFQQKIHQVYQCTEGFLAFTCREGNLHLNEDLVFFQERFLDDSRKRFHPVITDLYRRSQPIVRYELNDVLSYAGYACKCGCPFRVIERIEGRNDDVLAFERQSGGSVFVFGDFIRRLFLLADRDHGVRNYQVSQISLHEVAISLDIEDHTEKDHIERHIESEWKNFCAANHLKMPFIRFFDKINFDPMIKFRRIIRNKFPLPDNIDYL